MNSRYEFRLIERTEDDFVGTKSVGLVLELVEPEHMEESMVIPEVRTTIFRFAMRVVDGGN